jgi:exopolyphosphatase/pppGpp-phosphohydrolase
MKEAAIRMAEAYEHGKISRSDFEELFYYLEIELEKVDKEQDKKIEEWMLPFAPQL